MAFEDGLGQEPSEQSDGQEFRTSTTGLVTRTLNMWFSKLVQYIIIVGIASVAVLLASFFVLFTFTGITDIVSQDLFTYIFNLFTLSSFPDTTVVVITIFFAIVTIIVNAFVSGAAIKYTLDEYGFGNGDINNSFSHSIGRLVNIIVFQLFLSLIVAAVMVPSATLSASALEMIDISDPFNPIFPPGSVELLLGAFAIMIVGFIFILYVQVRLAPTLAIIIDTDLSVVDSMKRSWNITRGSFIHILGAQILLVIAIFVITILFSFIGEVLFGFATTYAILTELTLATLFTSALNFIFAAVLYRDLISRSDIDNIPGFVM